MIDRLYVGIRTHNTKDSGTNKRIVQIINRNGTDLLHHTFPDTSQSDLEKGKANLYRVKFDEPGIEPEGFTDSSFRIGIRGNDLWRPEHLFLWGALGEVTEVVPLAVETDLDVTLSTDESEGVLSVPVRLVESGPPSTIINRILVILTTSTAEDSGTKDPINLRISDNTGAVVDFDFPETPQDDRKTGEANFYLSSVVRPFAKSDLNNESTVLSIGGKDAWFMSRFFVFGLDTAEGRPNRIVPLIHLPFWFSGTVFKEGKLSQDPSEGKSEVFLPLA